LKAFLVAALLHVMRAVSVQAPASSSVVSSTVVRGFDTGVSGGPDVGALVKSVKTLQSAVSLLTSVPSALLRVELPSVRS